MRLIGPVIAAPIIRVKTGQPNGMKRSRLFANRNPLNQNIPEAATRAMSGYYPNRGTFISAGPICPGPPARWNGRYILGGMAIEDEWYDPDPGFDPATPRGVNIRMWDSDAGEWDMMWVHTSGKQVQDLRAGMVDGELTMWQAYPERPNFRATFHRLSADSWERITYARDEAGEWAKQFSLRATRIPCPSE